jgi:hypothetical protein
MESAPAKIHRALTDGGNGFSQCGPFGWFVCFVVHFLLQGYGYTR